MREVRYGTHARHLYHRPIANLVIASILFALGGLCECYHLDALMPACYFVGSMLVAHALYLATS